MNKKMILLVLFTILCISCGSKTSNDKENKEKVFYISTISKGADDKIEWLWQNQGGILATYLYRGLVLPEADLKEVKPDLAKEFTVSEDGKTYEFIMKEGLKWSDGEPLTAEDVEFSLKTALKVSVINGIFPENFLKIEGAKEYKDGKAESISGIKVENNKITIKMTEPSGMFLPVLGQFVILPKHSLEKENPLELNNNEFWKNPVTSGMFKVEEINSGNYIKFDINPNYEGVKPKFQKIILNYISDPVLAMKDGKSYFYSTNKVDEVSQLEQTGELTKYPVDILFYRYFIVNLSGINGKGNSVIADKKVREAILYAVNVKELTETLLKGFATQNSTGVPSDMPEYYKEANTYAYNPEKAGQLLKEANYDFNKILKIAYYYKDQNSADLMQAISFQLKEAGIKNEIILIQNDPTTGLFKSRNYDIAYKGLSSFGYESWYGEYSSNNTNFKNIYNGMNSFDTLIKELNETGNEAERKEILIKLQKLEQEELLKLPIFTMKNYIFINESAVSLPKELKLGNPFYRFNYKFEEWDIK